jgi:hypothetical protein
MSKAVLRTVVFGACMMGGAHAVTAQTISPPPRTSQPARPQGGRATNDMNLDVSFLAGYDQTPVNLTGTGPTIPIFGGLAAPRPGGPLALLDSSLTYEHGSSKRVFRTAGRGYVNSYRNSGTGPLAGGDASVGLSFVGRRNTFSLSQDYQNAPYYTAGVLGPISGVGGNPTLAFSNGRTWALGSGAVWDREWTRTTHTALNYHYGRFGYQALNQAQFINESHSGSLDVSRDIGRRWKANTTLQRSVTSNRQGNSYQPITEDYLEGGPSYTRPLSGTRSFTIAGKAGASKIHSSSSLSRGPYEYWTPRFSASGALDLGRTWSFNGSYQRMVTIPYALNTAPTEYVTHNVNGGVGGQMNERLQFSASVALTNGRTGTPALAGVNATYRAYTYTGQLQYELTPTLSTMFNVGYVQTHMNALASAQFGVVPSLQRTQVRGGLAWNVPIMGTGRRRGGG